MTTVLGSHHGSFTPLELAGMPAQLLRREAASPVRCVVLYLHAGAFTARTDSNDAVDALVQCGAAALVLHYPLAPAHPFPQALEASWRALQALHEGQVAPVGARTSLLVAGKEAGGNLAAALTLMARDRGGPQLAGQVLLSPLLDPYLRTASAREAGTGDAHCPIAEGWHHYLPRCCDAMHPYATPLHSQRLQNLPPALLVTSAADGLHDEGAFYAELLRAAGNSVHTLQRGDAGVDVDAGRASLVDAMERFLGSLDPPRRMPRVRARR